jgi:branched-chain amino acid transport system substrate-binding protein
MNSKLRVLSVLLGVVLIASACSSSTPGSTAAATSSGAPAASSEASVASGPSSYTFAVIGPFSGDNSAYGVNLQKGIQLSVDQINAGGGINGKQVQLQFLDTLCAATGAATAASKIASDPSVFAVMGDVCSSATLAALPILARAGITEVSGDSSSPKITDAVKAGNYTNFARTIPSDDVVAKNLVKLAVTHLNKTRVAAIYSSDNFGQGIWAYQEAAIGALGATLTDAETYTPTTTKDFTPQLTKIAASKPDVLLIDGYYNDAGPMVAQMARAGLANIPVIASAGIDQQGFIDLGGSAAEGAYVFTYYTPTDPSPANQTFVTQFKAKYGIDPNEQAAYGYELPLIFKQAIEKGATRETLATVVKTLTFVGPSGSTSFDANGDVVGKGAVVLTVQGGKFVVDTAATAAVAK